MKLYNDLTHKLEHFVPFSDKKVLLYVCGITPNNESHLGHAFTYVTFDILVRLFIQEGYSVTYTQNVTDINDDMIDLAKLENEAKKIGITWQDVAENYTKRFLQNMQKLNISTPTYYVKASDSIPQIIAMNEKLFKDGFAYQKGKNLYFDISKCNDYGKLSRYSEQVMLAFAKDRGVNIEDKNKRNPLDFLLWLGRDQKPFWESPFGPGIPGWHIECSAMSYQYLGPQIDIHGGGRDLTFPHHDSEIAQSESFTGVSPFAKYWMHIGTVMYGGEKMAKSLGNLILLNDLFKHYSGNELRWYLLSHHYRSPWEYSENDLKQKATEFQYIKRVLSFRSTKAKTLAAKHYQEEIHAAICCDLGTDKVLAYLLILAKRIEKEHTTSDTSELKTILVDTLNLLGFTM